MKYLLIVTGTPSNNLVSYLETGAGVGLWNYYAAKRIWISNGELTQAQANTAAAVGGSHIVIPANRSTNSLA